MAYIIATKIAKKSFEGKDKGESNIFHQFIHYWIHYECVKVLVVFGIQPTIRSDIESWSPELHAVLMYFTSKTDNLQYKTVALQVLDTLFDNTDHTGYFNKVNIAGKQILNHDPNPILIVVILSYLRQLQQLFYAVGEGVIQRDWNKHGRYFGTSKTTKDLKNIGMSKANSGDRVLIKDVSYFKPDENRKDVIPSLEEWAARLLKPHITELNKETRTRLRRAKQPSTFDTFVLSTTDYSTSSSTKPASTKQPITTIKLDVSPIKHKSKSTNSLMLALNGFFTTSIAAIETKQSSGKRRLSSEQQNNYTSTSEAASNFIALVNKVDDAQCESLEEIDTHLTKKLKTDYTKKDNSEDDNSSDDSESSSGKEEGNTEIDDDNSSNEE